MRGKCGEVRQKRPTSGFISAGTGIGGMPSSTLARAASFFPGKKPRDGVSHRGLLLAVGLGTFAHVAASAGGSSPSICRAMMTRFIVWLWPCKAFDEGSASMTNLSSWRGVVVLPPS